MDSLNQIIASINWAMKSGQYTDIPILIEGIGLLSQQARQRGRFNDANILEQHYWSYVDWLHRLQQQAAYYGHGYGQRQSPPMSVQDQRFMSTVDHVRHNNAQINHHQQIVYNSPDSTARLESYREVQRLTNSNEQAWAMQKMLDDSFNQTMNRLLH